MLDCRAVETCSSEGPHLRVWGSRVRVCVCTSASVWKGDGETPQAPRPLAVPLPQDVSSPLSEA